ncbi:MAG: STAS domain-containing protein [Planctomycetes bacterium]|nr:STAS domain-containing protein [Planctomycetota bacterium]
MPTQFSISDSVRQAGDARVRVLSLKGQLDAHTFPVLQSALEAITDMEPRVVLEFSGLDYISSAGLGVLSKMTKEFREREGDIRLAALPDKIRNIMDLLGFSQVIQVHGTVDDAVATYTS